MIGKGITGSQMAFHIVANICKMGRPYLFWHHEPVYYIVGSTDHFANMKYRQAIMPLHLDTNVMKRMTPLTHSQIFLTQKPDFEFLVEQKGKQYSTSTIQKQKELDIANKLTMVGE